MVVVCRSQIRIALPLGFGDLLRLAKAPYGVQLGDLLVDLRMGAGLHPALHNHGGLDKARAERVDADA